MVWERGDREDGTDCLVRQIAPEHHWPELRALILVVSTVVWERGDREDGTDCLIRQIAPEHHWPELRALILVVSNWTY